MSIKERVENAIFGSPEERTFRQIVEKKSAASGRQAYAQGYEKAVMKREMDRGKAAAVGGSGFGGKIGGFLDNVDTNRIFSNSLSGSGGKKKKFNPAASPFE